MKWIERIFGSQGAGVYITRVKLTPRTPWGQGLLHIFWRGYEDPDPHDHPWDFWTLPLNRGYIELYWLEDGTLSAGHVPALRVTRRRAEHTHRVLLAPVNKFPIVTLLWTRAPRREWGFKLLGSGDWVHWRDYLKIPIKCDHRGERRKISCGVQDPGDEQCLKCGRWKMVYPEGVLPPYMVWQHNRLHNVVIGWTNQHPYGPRGREQDRVNPFLERNEYD